MSGSLPQSLAGSNAPNTLELLWERNRKIVQGLFWLLAAALLGYYGLRYYEQRELNAKWSRFAAAGLLHNTYSPEKVDAQMGTAGYEAVSQLLDDLRDTPIEKFEQAIATAEPAQIPYLLWLEANHAARAGDLEKATLVADQLKQRYASHPLVAASAYPVQVREPVKKDPAKEDEEDQVKPGKEPELQPEVAGSLVAKMLEQLTAAKAYVAPSHFRMPAIPADAPRYRITFEGDRGSFVVALMTADAPKHCQKFDELVAEQFWTGVKIDEIARPGKTRWNEQVWQIHFGFESTKTEANRSDWDTTVASKEAHIVEEISPLSHFAGAVSARARDGKSEVDRLYVCASDCAVQDDARQVFAYVVEGLENVRAICEASFDRSEDEDLGRGRPAENIAIKSVEKL